MYHEQLLRLEQDALIDQLEEYGKDDTDETRSTRTSQMQCQHWTETPFMAQRDPGSGDANWLEG